jgi:DivIVA domain-containing protein
MSDPTGFEPGATRRVLTPADIQQKEFRVSRFGGYKMRDVDEFLDEITDSFSALSAEVERLRARPGAPPVVGTPDLDDVARQADEIISRARGEAARIVAEARTGSPAPMGVNASAEGRAAVGAFLTEEREFLQSLAGLVQGHAETVKAMVKAARGHPAPPSSPEPAPAEENVIGEEPREETDEERGVAAGRQEGPPEEPRTADASADSPSATRRMPTAEEPLRIDEPSGATVSGGDDEPRPDRPEGSLRDLFWGEE